MEIYIVDKMLTGFTKETADQFFEDNFFNPLKELIAANENEFILENELKAIAVAIVSCTEKGVSILKENGFEVHENGTVQAF